MSFEAWFAQAEDDLAAARTLLGAGHNSQAIWLAAQASEKAHKALVFALGLTLPDQTFSRDFNHRANSVVDALPKELQEPRDLAIGEAATALDAVQGICRYPQRRGAVVVAPCQNPSFGKVEAAEHVERGAKLVGWCRDRAKRARLGVEAMKPPAPAPP